jgi:O-methyltransferase
LTEARRHNSEKMNFYAFDSFEGLPEVENETAVPFWQKGALTTSEDQFMGMIREHKIYVDRVHTIKGYYSDSLTAALRESFVSKGSKVSLVNIDCDLYESAVPVFNFLEPLLQDGTVIYIDDFFAGYRGSPKKGVQLAFSEFLERSAFQFIEHMQIGWWGRSYIAYR